MSFRICLLVYTRRSKKCIHGAVADLRFFELEIGLASFPLRRVRVTS
jgi:hypothetical protein